MLSARHSAAGTRGDQPLIVNIASMYGRRGMPGWAAYCSSKFAVCGFSEALRAELAVPNIDLMLVLPGITRTDFGQNVLAGARFEINWGGTAAHAAGRIIQGIERNRAEVQIGSDARRLISVNRLFPRLADRRLRKKALREAHIAAVIAGAK